jgi:hypothetical protein
LLEYGIQLLPQLNVQTDRWITAGAFSLLVYPEEGALDVAVPLKNGHTETISARAQ